VAPGMRVNRRTASGAVRTREAAKACSRAEMRRSSAAPLRRAEAAWKAVLQEVEGVDVDDSCGLRDLLGVGVGDSTVEEFGEQSAFRGFEEELEAMLAFEASKRSGGGTEDADTFAIERIRLWHQEGADVQALLPHLSVYLGHVRPQESYWYLTATPELLSVAATRFQRYARGESTP